MNDYMFPVELQNAYTPSGKLIKNKKAVVRTDNGEAIALVSNGYSLITHEEVIEPMSKLIKSLGGQFITKTHLGKGGAVLHYISEFKDKTKALKVGDKCGMRIIVKNSYDGSGSTSIRIGAIVLSCMNGMVKHNGFVDLRVRHIGNAKERLIYPTTEELLQEFDDGWRIWDSLGSRRLELVEYRDTVEKMKATGILPGSVADEWAHDAGDDVVPETAWDFMQKVTYNLTHDRPKMGEDSRIRLLSSVNRIFTERFSPS